MVVKENFSRDMVDMLAHDISAGLATVAKGLDKRDARHRRRPHC
jgi:hypothetical protein